MLGRGSIAPRVANGRGRASKQAQKDEVPSSKRKEASSLMEATELKGSGVEGQEE